MSEEQEAVFSKNGTIAAASASSPSTTTSGSIGQKADNKRRDQKERFRYGNFNRYYGIRTKGMDTDPRLELFPPDWFKDRRVLDIGCNAGHLTLDIAKRLSPAWILGIDIDDHLIGVARKNIRHYFEGEKRIGKYPAKLGDHNVWFARENYVLESDEFLEMVREEYDLILALSITKWVHLNWGDAGIRRFLRRTFLQLNPGGRLILEAQDFGKYYKRSKMTPDMFETYKGIQFKSDQFREYLLSNEVGFVECEELGVPKAMSKGFERPIMVFKKGQQNLRKRKQQKEKEIVDNEEKGTSPTSPQKQSTEEGAEEGFVKAQNEEEEELTEAKRGRKSNHIKWDSEEEEE